MVIFAIFYSYMLDDVGHQGDFFVIFPYYFYFFQHLPRIQGGKHCDEGFKLARPNIPQITKITWTQSLKLFDGKIFES
jgi:hypothetical protein